MTERMKQRTNRQDGLGVTERTEQQSNEQGRRGVATRNKYATCPICPKSCTLAEGQIGACKARRAADSVVVAENYGRITSLALDPIEKKPFARFKPGTWVLSVGSYGCNLRCPWCQNASIAQVGAKEASWREMSPQALVSQACKLRERGNIGVAFTYNEPLVGFEFVRDTARLAHEAGLLNIVVTNGQINEEPLTELAPLIDAANIDLKGFSTATYERIGGSLSATKRCIETLVACESCHVEVTTLIVPDVNDAEQEIDAMTSWLASLSREIPYHVSRFFPCYRMRDAKPTPVETVYKLADVARRHLPYVFSGNC